MPRPMLCAPKPIMPGKNYANRHKIIERIKRIKLFENAYGMSAKQVLERHPDTEFKDYFIRFINETTT